MFGELLFKSKHFLVTKLPNICVVWVSILRKRVARTNFDEKRISYNHFYGNCKVSIFSTHTKQHGDSNKILIIKELTSLILKLIRFFSRQLMESNRLCRQLIYNSVQFCFTLAKNWLFSLKCFLVIKFGLFQL